MSQEKGTFVLKAGDIYRSLTKGKKERIVPHEEDLLIELGYILQYMENSCMQYDGYYFGKTIPNDRTVFYVLKESYELVFLAAVGSQVDYYKYDTGRWEDILQSIYDEIKSYD